MNDKKNVFASPTVASLQRLGRRSPSRSRLRGDQSDCNSDTSSVARSHYSKTSRRSISRIQTQEDAELFDNLSVSTSVKLSRRRRENDELDPGSQIIDVVEGALNLLRSLSPTSPTSNDGSNMDGYTPGLPSSLRARQDLDLRNNDNSFHVLASLLVEFFQQRVRNRRLTLLPDDRRTIERLLPESARIPFVEAVQYRLASTPVAPRTPLHLLTLQCQELGFNLHDDANPILAACQMTNEPLSLAVLKVLETDDDDDADDDDHVDDDESSCGADGAVARRNDDPIERDSPSPRGNDTKEEVESLPDDVSSTDELSEGGVSIDNCDDGSVERQNKFAMTMSMSNVLTGNKQYRLTEYGEQIEETVDVRKETPKDSNKYLDMNTQQSQEKNESQSSPLAYDEEANVINPTNLVENTSTTVDVAPVQENEETKSLPPQLDFTLSSPDKSIQSEKSPMSGINEVTSSDAKYIQANEPIYQKPSSPHGSSPPREQDNTKQTSTSNERSPKSPKSHTRSTQNSPHRMDTEMRSFPPFDNRNNYRKSSTKRSDDTVDKSNPLIFTSQSTVEWFSSLFSSSVSMDPSNSVPMEKHRGLNGPDGNMNRYLPHNQTGADLPRIKPVNPFDAYPEALHRNSMDQSGLPRKHNHDHTTNMHNPRVDASPIPNSIDGPSHMIASTPNSQALSDLIQTTVLMNRPENLAQRQLWIELREATALMQQSQNPETEKFWLEHVIDLQSRLDELQGKKSGSSLAPILSTGQNEEVILEQNRRLISEFQHRERSFAPTLSANASSDSPVAVIDIPDKQSFSSHNTTTVESSRGQSVTAVDYDMPMVDVISPADLPGGYHFEAEIEGQRFLATVPAGGVREGEAFTCYMRELGSVAIEIPVGYWKDDMSQICRYGLCHCVVINTLLCPLITLSQIQFRTKLDFLGRPLYGSAGLSNRTIMFSIVAFWTITNLLLFGACNLKWSRGLELSNADISAFVLINLTMLGFVIFVTQSTRGSLREKFMIREERCLDLEDICCAAWCLPCTVCHMARHTANYDEYEAVCCSKSGLPDGVRVTDMSFNAKATSSDVYLL